MPAADTLFLNKKKKQLFTYLVYFMCSRCSTLMFCSQFIMFFFSCCFNKHVWLEQNDRILRPMAFDECFDIPTWFFWSLRPNRPMCGTSIRPLVVLYRSSPNHGSQSCSVHAHSENPYDRDNLHVHGHHDFLFLPMQHALCLKNAKRKNQVRNQGPTGQH